MAARPLAGAFEHLIPPGTPLAVKFHDGSVAGTPGAPLGFELTTPTALSYLLSAPGELGLARAYVTGHLRITGGIYEVLDATLPLLDTLRWQDAVQMLRELGPRYLRRVPQPPEELPGKLRRTVSGLRHSRPRDEAP